MLCACAKENKTVADDVSVDEGSTANVEEATAEEATEIVYEVVDLDESTEEADESEEEVNIDDESAALYDAFLQGSAKATFDSNGDKGEYIVFSDFLNDGEDYTLPEIISKMTGEDQYCSNRNCEKCVGSYIDCGLDGNIEKLVDLILDGGTDYFHPCMVIKNFDGKLKICYDADSWSRCSTDVSYNGQVSSSGANGADSHGSKSGYIDSLGHYNFWYDENVYVDFFVEGTDSLYLETYEFGDGNIYCDFGFMDCENIKDNPNDSDNPYNIAREILKKDYGYKVVSQEEIDKMIYEKRLEIGLTDEIYDNR